MFRDGKLLQQTIGFVSLWFSMHTSGTRFTILLDVLTESGPGIISMDKVDGLVLTRVSREDVVVLVA